MEGNTPPASESTTEATSSPVASSPAPSGEASPSAGLNLSDDAQITTDIAEGIRRRATSRAEASGSDEADDEGDEADDDESDGHAEGAGEPAPAQPAVGEQPQQAPLRGRAKLRADLAAAREEAAQLRQQVTQVQTNLGLTNQRYAEVKPQEAQAVLSDPEFSRLEYIESHGGLSYDDQLTLETARTLRQFRGVWITDADERVAKAGQTVKDTFIGACNATRETWGVKPELINAAPTFEDLLNLYGKSGYEKAKAEFREENARLKQDNTALSARSTGATARSLELGGRSAPGGVEQPGPDASSSDLIAAGIRARSQRRTRQLTNGRH